VTITGSGFALGSATKFLFGKVSATGVSCGSSTSCQATAPKGAATGTVDVFAVVSKVKSVKSPANDSYTYE
jgi:hypothetical protein